MVKQALQACLPTCSLRALRCDRPDSESIATLLVLQVAYQRFYESLVARLTPEPEELSARPAGARNLMAVRSTYL